MGRELLVTDIPINIPNSLTVLRILLVPVFVGLLLYNHFDFALFTLLIAALTDVLDGMVARLTDQRTRLGEYLDPLADKLLLMSAIITLSVLNFIPIWAVIIVVSRDAILLTGTVVANLTETEIDISPTALGKGTTFVQICYVIATMLHVNGKVPEILVHPFLMGYGGTDIGLRCALFVAGDSICKWLSKEDRFRGGFHVIRERVGHQLVEAKVVSSEDLVQALAIQQTEGGRLGSILVGMGVLSESTLLEFLSQQYDVPTVELSTCSFDHHLLSLLPGAFVQKYLVIPVKQTASRLTLAMADPTDLSLLDELRFRTGLNISPMVASESDIRTTIKQRYGEHKNGRSAKEKRGSGNREMGQQSPEVRSFSEVTPTVFERGRGLGEDTHSPSPLTDKREFMIAPDASAVDVVNALVQQAIEMNASDIHIEPLESVVRIRFRLDGVLRPMRNLPKGVHQSLLARLKILSDLDIAERRLPQDGRMKLDECPQVDIRVAILPCLFGEKAVLRLLNQSGLALHLTNLGLDQPDLDRVITALENPYGMILVTGPTGSGKTTTLYSALQYLNTPHMNIVTVEDPVEFQIQGINQLQIHEEIGLSFSTGLRSFLRQDPDVMMVGEIRDRETAHIGIQASLTGHRVLSTLHTMDGPGAITRLIDMGIEPFLVSSAVSLIMGQRLVRKICDSCAELDPVSPIQLQMAGVDENFNGTIQAMKGRGCQQCHMTGYKGRMALFEVLPIQETLHEKILSRASTSALRACARQEGFRSLRQAGLMAVRRGLTTLSEILAETSLDGLPIILGQGRRD